LTGCVCVCGQQLLLTHITILFLLCPQKSPVFLQKSPVFLQKSPVFLQKSPVFPRVMCVMYVVADSYDNSVLADRYLWIDTTGLILQYCTTGLRRLIGCLKLQGIFRKRATNCRALLRNMTCKDKAFYGSLPPCTRWAH